MTNIRKELTRLVFNEGVWADTYRWDDAEVKKIDEHRCSMRVRFPGQPPYAYHPLNMYTWKEGRAVTKDFQIPASRARAAIAGRPGPRRPADRAPPLDLPA